MPIDSYKYPSIPNLKYSEESGLPLYFLGVDHRTDHARFMTLHKEISFSEGDILFIEDSTQDPLTQKKISMLQLIPSETTVRCWDDPSYCRDVEYLLKVETAYKTSINPMLHKEEEKAVATQLLREFHADYCSEKYSRFSWLFPWRETVTLKPYPDPSTQNPAELFESRSFLQTAINEKKLKLFETHFLKRQEHLCQSITTFNEWDQRAWWIAGIAHFTMRPELPQSSTAEQMFFDAIKQTGRNAIRIDLS